MTFEGVQILRGIAASLVVFHHACWVINNYHPAKSALASTHGLAQLGAGGVDIFFCISGLVIAYAARSSPSGWNAAGLFAWRRILRVLPPYWVFTAALLALWVVGLGLRELIVTPGLVASSLLLIPYPKMTATGHLSYHPILDVGWTLTFEMYFYAVCTLIIAAMGGRRVWPWIVVALGLAAIAISLTLGPGSVTGSVLASPLLLEFIAGVMLAQFVAGRQSPRIGLALIALGVAGFCGSIFIPYAMEWRALCWGVPGALMVAGATMLPIGLSSRPIRFLSFLGTASYTIYLAHPFAMLITGTLMKRGLFTKLPPDVVLIALTVAAIVGSAASYFVIEGPLLQLLKPRSRTAAEARAVVAS